MQFTTGFFFFFSCTSFRIKNRGEIAFSWFLLFLLSSSCWVIHRITKKTKKKKKSVTHYNYVWLYVIPSYVLTGINSLLNTFNITHMLYSLRPGEKVWMIDNLNSNETQTLNKSVERRTSLSKDRWKQLLVKISHNVIHRNKLSEFHTNSKGNASHFTLFKVFFLFFFSFFFWKEINPLILIFTEFIFIKKKKWSQRK